MKAPTRREALVTIAAVSAGCSAARGQQAGVLSADLRRLEALVDTILPATETPGAAEAGVARMLVEDAAEDEALAAGLRELLATADGFEALSADERAAWMTDLMNDDPERFQLLKDLTIDRYYATEIGLVDELGYQGNTYLAEFPGCTHEHILEPGEEEA